jgi:hypothetical protein
MKEKKKKSKKVAEERKITPRRLLLRNLLVTAIAGWMVFLCIEKQVGYQQIYHILKGNMAFIRQFPGKTNEQRLEVKLGMSYTYLQFIKRQTPEDAVILYPDWREFFPEGVESPFNGEITNKIWATRFLYPRKIVLSSERDKNRYGKHITHVAIVNGTGFEKVNYPVAAKFEHGVLPFNP